MENLFREKNTFNEDIGGWDVSKVTNMQWMFDDKHCGAESTLKATDIVSAGEPEGGGLPDAG